MNQQTSIKDEYNIYQKLKKEFDHVKNTDLMKEVNFHSFQVYIINNTWYKKWKKYAKSKAANKTNFPGTHEKLFLKETKNEIHPGKINNSDLVYDHKEFINSTIDGTTDYVIRPDRKDYIKLVSKKIWDFLHSIYKGGPEIKRISYVQKIAIIVAFSVLAARDDQQILLRNNIDLFGLEPGNCDGDLIAIFAGAFDIERRIVFICGCASGVFEQFKQAVKTDSVPAIRCKIKTLHIKFSIKQFGVCQPRMSSGQLCRFGALRPPRHEMGSAHKIAR